MTAPGKGMPLHTKIFIGLLLGAIAGGVAQWQLGADHEGLRNFNAYFAGPIGQLFLSLIFMVVIPLLFSALVLGVAELGDARKVGRIGLRAITLTVILSGIAVVLGILAVNVVRPGDGVPREERDRLMAAYGQAEKAEESVQKSQEAKNISETLVDFVPRNPLASAVDALGGGLIPFMFFALVFGIALASIEPDKAMVMRQFLEALFSISLKIIGYAMAFAPIGVFGLIFVTASTLGWDAVAALAKYAVLVLVVLAFHMFFVYSGALALVAKRNPFQFFYQVRNVIMTAFSTSSSNATLPVAIRAAEDEVGLPKDISRFVLTVGATANQNGTALFEGITVLFLAQFFGVDLSLGEQLVVMGMSIVAGIGTAGVPGGSWPMIAIILAKVGVDPVAIGLCLGIDRILDMSRTTLNVVGDITIATCVSEWEGRSKGIPEKALG